ncbi:DUF5683 domain-containing protein [Luteibaculum oceani]|uniref:DUF5683 domain-containing protein n=1 Tax=Luteibaculum oceani TaxID=1294296 RepID=A0A5C6UWV9_9FLAO|nr:DUF5683 domain-containing protein [Luteibaculum oceani]TXC77070.1 hypothetical protein FRX97_09410 [Luteibaculum oceani]
MLRYFFLSVLIISSHFAFSQRIENAKGVEKRNEVFAKEKSPHTASILSAAFPGAGHLYIGQWYKSAIIWAGIGGGIYAINFNSKLHKEHKQAYIARLDDDPNTNATGVYATADINSLKENMDFYRKNRDLSIILTSFGYVLNIIWATVDTHLLYFDISDDISLNIRPSLNYFDKPNTGITLALTLK